ncbi:MAG: hypothetical protein LBH78_03465 [Rickettsiales bacterium]|jgi:hypothetical protein|nr:hypothetical protein [Rickettsiales bacterium]
MKLKKVGIALCLSASLLVLGACNSSKGSTTTPKSVKTETVAFQKDINQKNERVWLITSSEDFGKDSKIKEAIHVKDGKAELITPVATLKDLDKLKDNKVWDYLVKTGKDNYKEHRQSYIDYWSNLVKNDQNPYTKDGFTSEEDFETSAKNNKKALDLLNKTTELKPVVLQSKVSIATDTTGNETNSERIDFDGTPEVKALLGNNYQVRIDLESLNEPVEILQHTYLSFEMKDNQRVLTRKNNNFKGISFDKVNEKGVEEIQDND